MGVRVGVWGNGGWVSGCGGRWLGEWCQSGGEWLDGDG